MPENLEHLYYVVTFTPSFTLATCTVESTQCGQVLLMKAEITIPQSLEFR